MFVATRKVSFKLKRGGGGGGQHEKCRYRNYGGLSGVTVITKDTKEPNNRVLLGVFLIGLIVSFVERNLCLGTYRRNQVW